MTLAKAKLTNIDKNPKGSEEVLSLLKKFDDMRPAGQVSDTVSNFLMPPPRPPSGEIEFMFNPKDLSFEGEVKSNDNPGAADGQSGKPKVSFSNIEVYKVGIHNIMFDTYETGVNVVTRYIDPFKQAVQFISEKQRPPVYTFSWGEQIYLKYCFVEKFSYKLTMFLADGTPVRAVIDNLTLKEVDLQALEKAVTPPPQPDRNNDSMKTRPQRQPQSSS
jgi:hypothetical protein